jgi:hypothetical protein
MPDYANLAKLTEPAATHAEAARRAQKHQTEPLAATRFGGKLAVAGEVNRMITAAINANPEWFWHGPDARLTAIFFLTRVPL